MNKGAASAAAVLEQVTETPSGTLRVKTVGGKVVSVTFEPGPLPKGSATDRDRPHVCTDCGAASTTLRWFPFTVYACPTCAAKRDAAAQRERAMGEVCARCRQPYSLCVC